MNSSLSALLKKYNLSPRKGLGQNFLADPFHLQKIVDAADLSPTDIVLEIGPGPGTLTRLLADTAGQVVAVELDPHMVNLLKNEYGHLPNLTIIEADILKVSISDLLSVVSGQKTQNSELETRNLKPETQNYKVVANLPYYITSAVLRHLLESIPRPERLVVTVQKEVARRMVAKPGKMSLLAVSVQLYGHPTLAHHIPSGAFYPPPKVDSAVVRVDTYPHLAVPVANVEKFFQVVRAGFSQKRKQLKNSLAAGLHKPAAEIVTSMEQVDIAPTRRAQTLSLAEWGRLVEALEAVL